jgi:hypothetical protein
MDLSSSQTARERLKEILICFTLGNLVFLRAWYDLDRLESRSLDYFRVVPLGPNLFLATLCAALLLSAILFLLGSAIRRFGNPVVVRMAQAAFLAVLLWPIESVRRYWNELSTSTDLPSNIALFVIEGLLAAGLIAALFGRPRIYLTARRVTLLMTMLFPILMLDFLLARLNTEPASEFATPPPAPVLPSRANAPRVVWIIFDELDERLTFERRPESLALPELDRLRSESLHATQAGQTARMTMMAMPSLFSGRLYEKVTLTGARGIKLYPAGSKEPVEWQKEDNVFRRARKLGVNTALVDWHHSTCRLFGDSMVRCYSVSTQLPEAMLRARRARVAGVSRTILTLFREQWTQMIYSEEEERTARERVIAGEQQQHFFSMRDEALRDVSDPSIDFAILHLPTPHLPPIYNRRRGDFDLSGSPDYFDNVALADRTLGDIRRAIAQAGLDNRTSLLVTSDHGFRPEIWRGHLGWTPELEHLSATSDPPLVPFLLHLAGETDGAVFEKPFSNIVSGDLCLALLRGEVSSPDEAAHWLSSFVR